MSDDLGLFSLGQVYARIPLSNRIPNPPLLLGLAGLLPFFALTLAIVFHVRAPLNVPSAASALATYAAVILSFLGGIRWGIAVMGRLGVSHYAISVLPSLIGWGLLAAPEPWRLAGLGLVALGLGPLDSTLAGVGAVPIWFGRLRLLLSTCAGLSLLIAAVWAT